MSLSTRVQARYSTQYLTNITNPQNSGGNSIDTTKFDAAITDVEAQFEIYAGTEYDDTNDRHGVVGVELVVSLLLWRNGHGGGKERYDAAIKALKALALVEGRDRIAMTSNSNMTATQEPLGTKPADDRNQFAGRYTPGQPSGTAGSNPYLPTD